MQSLCTLRNHCRQWPRNTRYQAGRYPLLGPDFHRLDRTSLRLAHLFDHLVGEREQAASFSSASTSRVPALSELAEIGDARYRGDRLAQELQPLGAEIGG